MNDADDAPRCPAWVPERLKHLVRPLLGRQTMYSLVSALAAFILLITILIDLVLHSTTVTPLSVRLGTLLLSALCTLVPLWKGRRYPGWAGLIPVGLVFAVTVYYIGFSGDEQAIVNSLQELPIFALYLGWFYRSMLGRIILTLAGGAVGWAILISDSFSDSGEFTIPLGAGALGIMVICFEVGSYLQRTLERQAIHDHLTEALNRRGFSERFAREHERSRRLGTPLIAAMIDFDRLKRVNDAYGHAAGDELLRVSVQTWQSQLGTSDVVGRVGGDEFIILLPHRSLSDARQLLGELRAAAAHSWTWGLTEVLAGDTLESVIARADAELYARKAVRDE